MEQTQTKGEILLECRNIQKSWNGPIVLDNVDFSVVKGEVHSLVGENGAGKSTLIKIVTGATNRNSGEITFNGYALHDITTTAPAAPANLAAIPSNAQIGLTWTAAGGASGCNVKRSTTSGAGYATLGSATTTAYTDNTAVNGTTYYYVRTGGSEIHPERSLT